MRKVLMKTDNDNVATALEDIIVGDMAKVLSHKNEVIDEFKAYEPIPFGNKIAVKDISEKSEIIKCGYKIGLSLKVINKGQFVHVHNVQSEKVNFPPSIIKEILRQMGREEAK
ncbi:D-galactarate dehydratase [Oceanirhabdus sp. W0125-5]|uniref:D-galactarate dehydratase n=1 Tax=Oceanirhabdus sp. W0125-5 TaxID=2999116 RepID=UPI0022F2EB5E|nr:D-galactarate dehydratase [Oceanirhabdus sp. W0125-5]WBW96463.1 D-galactarate dehydratase [Oceanirhabdus sp. W0125-5]